MIVLLMLIAIIIGYIRKGKLRNLANLNIKLVPLLVLAFLLQGMIFAGYNYDIAVIQEFDILIHFVSYILLFAALMSNFDNKWFVVMTLGTILNFLVIFLNGGKMPVSIDALEAIGMADGLELMFARRAGTHQPLADGMLLWFLADIIPVSLPSMASLFNSIYSIGDFFIYAGAVGLIQYSMTQDRLNNTDDNLDMLMDEDLLDHQVAESMFEDDVDEEEVNRLRALRQKREEETRRIFQDEAENYFDQERSPLQQTTSPTSSLVKDQDNVLVDDIPTEDHVEESTEPEQADETSESELLPETFESPEPEWKLYTQDFSNAELIGFSQLEEQIVKGEDFTEEEWNRQRRYYTKPLHERMAIDLESDGYDWIKKEEEPTLPPSATEEEPQQISSAPPLPVDTTHAFIIVDGRIVENPNYRKAASPRPEGPVIPVIPVAPAVSVIPMEMPTIQHPANDAEPSDLEPIREAKPPVEEAVESPPEDTPISSVAEEGSLFDPQADGERIQRMKKMQERQEKGYSLVQVQVGDKTITFWKKDL
jgi:hypothetical protein